MADWSALQPLKTQSRILGLIALGLIALLLLTPKHTFRAQAVESSERNGSAPTVNAIGGLSIRQNPTINSKLLTTVPNKTVLTILDENAGSDNVGGKSGNWCKVEY